ncbi:hypothetical protein LG651_15395 [Tamlana sp. 62-3]|uniref:Uncharacterized protein n=1 Tax=Neotamlana sargassicola TaxID=2883125 RepID=A0A9X1I8A1_9FLAO|nr:hypothetical protein [Tamlana sargassicola]MCB4809640.1 hypothetical protein [Tamlana sargassicola]
MSRKIEFPKIDERTQKVVDRMSGMDKKEEHETLLPLNVVVVNELRKDIERNNKTQNYYNIVILVITLLSFLIMAIEFFSDDEEQLKFESSKTEYEAKKPTLIDTVDHSHLKHNEELQKPQNEEKDSLK